MEILIEPGMTAKGTRILQALPACAPRPCTVVSKPSGNAKVLMIYGAGNPGRKKLAEQHHDQGGRLVLWDIGYFAQQHFKGAMRFSVDRMHPLPRLLDLVPDDGSRWQKLGIALREDYNPKGHIVIVGLGQKSRNILPPREKVWEAQAFQQLKKRFPGREVVLRPKPGGHSHPPLPCRIDAASPIEAVLKGASLVVVKHSNVALDAAVAGIPFEAEDGIARWLADKPYTPANRLELLQRTMWFNYHASEAAQAWQMIERCL